MRTMALHSSGESHFSICIRSNDSIGSSYRFVVMHNVPFGRDTHQGIFVARIEYLNDGLRIVRLLNVKGKDTGATLLVQFHIREA
jgi:hypothetical protein